MVRKKVTIRDIAERVGVSPSTVSRALSNAPGVGEELRVRIKNVAKDMGYIPNMVAKTLRKSTSKTVGLIIPDITNPFFIEFIEGVDSVFFSKEYKFIVGNTDENVDRERTYIEWLLSHGVDGIRAAPTASREGDNSKLFKNLIKMGMPLMMFDRMFENMKDKVDSVCIDNELAIYESLSHLKSMGHKSVGIILGKMEIYTMRIRLEAFLKGVEKLDLTTKDSWILKNLFPEKEAVEKIAEFLSSDDRPTSVVISNQSLIRSFLKASRDIGVRIPRDVSVVGFDDAVENEFYDPPLTTVRQPAKEMGKIAATILLGRIEGDKSRPYRVVLRTELVIRDSVRPLKERSG